MPQNLSLTSIADTPTRKERPSKHKREASRRRKRHLPFPIPPHPYHFTSTMNFTIDEYESVGERGAYRNAILVLRSHPTCHGIQRTVIDTARESSIFHFFSSS